MSKTTVDAREKRSFKMHDRLLVDVITKQAGTLDKGVTEAVMNSIDAGARKIAVTVSENRVTVEDDGKGFRGRQEIEQYFETFGQPHDESENKIYGTFRMGRGQAFAFGRNVWRSGEFEMIVDIRKEGISYDLKTGLEHFPGCRVEIELYTPLGHWEQRHTIDQIKTAIRFVDTDVVVNGEKLNTPPADEKWDYEIPGAFINLRDSGSMKVYNLGVFVRSYAPGQFGTGGVIVSRQRLAMNFARNDILAAECPVWKAIQEQIGSVVDRNPQKTKLTEAGRVRLTARMLSGTLPNDEAYTAPVFRDASRRWWSIERMVDQAPKFSKKISATNEEGGQKGDMIMQSQIALVLDEGWFACRFEAKTIDELVKKRIKPVIDAKNKDNLDLDNRPWEKIKWPYEILEFKKLADGIDSTYQLIEKKSWTAIETAILETIRSTDRHLVGHLNYRTSSRRILLGTSGSANGWTDGETYIAINREFLKKVGVDYAGWVRIGGLVLHEYCHGAPSSATHDHSPEFHELFHQATMAGAIADFAEQGLRGYLGRLESANRRLTKKQLLAKDKADRAAKMTTQVEQLSESVAASTTRRS